MTQTTQCKFSEKSPSSGQIFSSQRTGQRFLHLQIKSASVLVSSSQTETERQENQPPPSRSLAAAHLSHNELSILRTVQRQLLSYVSEGDPRVGKTDHAHASFDDIVPQADDEGVGVLRLELWAKLGQHLIELRQVPCPHGWNKIHPGCLVRETGMILGAKNLTSTSMNLCLSSQLKQSTSKIVWWETEALSHFSEKVWHL